MHVGFARASLASSLTIAFIWACGSRTQLDTPYGPNAGAGVNEPEKPSRCNVTKVTELAHRYEDATPSDFWDQIVLDADDVYFHANGTLRRVPKSGGAVEVVATQAGGWDWPSRANFVVDSRGLAYVTNRVDGLHIARANVNGGEPVILGPKLPLSGTDVHLTANATGYFLWGQTSEWSATDGILTVDDNGVPTSPVASNASQFISAVIDESPLPAYVATNNGLARYDDPTKGVITVITTLVPFATYNLIDGGDALYAVGANTATPLHYEIVRIDKATLQRSVVVDYGNEILGIAVDATHLYFCDRMAATVVKVSRDGGATTIVGPAPSSQAQSIEVAVDDDCVYWTVLDGPNDGVARLFAARKGE
jgi:hypothetical protein